MPCLLSASLSKSGPFPQPALPGVLSPTGLSATPPARPAPHEGPVGACTPPTGLPVLLRLPSSAHASAITPAGTSRCARRFASRSVIGLPLIAGGSAPASPFSRPAQRSLAFRPARSLSCSMQPFVTEVLQSMSLPPRPAPAATNRKRQLLGGIRTHQENAPFHGALQYCG